MTKWLVRNLVAGVALGSVVVGAAPAKQPEKKATAAVSTTNANAVDRDLLHVQVILDHLGFSPGMLDGKPGISLTAALKGFQEARGLPITGKTDQPTLAALHPYAGWRPTRTLRLSADALAGPFVNPIPHDEDEQAKLPALAYRNAMEKLAEMFHTTPAVLVALNSPTTRLAPGTEVTFPNALPTSRAYDSKLPEAWRATLSSLNVDANQPQGAKIVVDKSDGVLRVLDKDEHLIAQFQVTTGSSHDPLPLGAHKMTFIDRNPKFHFNPNLFWDAKSTDTAAMLPPGPNGPVGVVWLDLNIPHYGIHGTPEPQFIGRTESHGCVRMANWNAARLAQMVKPGVPVVFPAMTRVGWTVLAAIIVATGLFASMVRIGGPPRMPLARASFVAGSSSGASPDGSPVLQLPVAGVRRDQIVDTWGQARGEGRQHHGTDIIAPGGTPVLAAAAGTVEKLFQSRLGGTTLYERSVDRRWTFYYAHLSGYAPGVHEGQTLRAGEVIAYVGDTGDAGPGNYHLHFSTARLTPEQHWWQGEDVNAYPMLRGR